MARFFYEAALEVLFEFPRPTFTEREWVILGVLFEDAKQSDAVYWDRITMVMPGTQMHLVIESIKEKCRKIDGLDNVFELLKEKYKDTRT